jgi:hypothetical protein
MNSKAPWRSAWIAESIDSSALNTTIDVEIRACAIQAMISMPPTSGRRRSSTTTSTSRRSRRWIASRPVAASSMIRPGPVSSSR